MEPFYLPEEYSCLGKSRKLVKIGYLFGTQVIIYHNVSGKS